MSKFDSLLRQKYAASFGATRFSELRDRVRLDSTGNAGRRHMQGRFVARGFGIAGLSAAACIAALLLPIGMLVFGAGFQTTSSFRHNARISQIDVMEAKRAHKTYLNALNSISYPSSHINYAIESSFTDNLDRFSEKLVHKLSKNQSYIMSPLGLYGNLHLASLGISDADLMNQVDALLGGDTQSRSNGVKKAFMNNFFSSSSNQVFASQMVAINDKFAANPTYIDDLTDNGAEAYGADFNDLNTQDEILKWMSDSSGGNLRLSRDDVFTGDPNEWAMLLLSALYFDCRWQSLYDANLNTELPFYVDGIASSTKTFMNHTVYSYFYEHDRYVSCFDYFHEGYSIQYFVPKEHDDFILDLLPEDFLKDESEASSDVHSVFDPARKYVALSVPKFSSTSLIDFTDTLKQLGLSELYNKNANVLRNAFDETVMPMERSYLGYTKQGSGIELKEDGSRVYSVAFSLMRGAGAAAPMGDVYRVVLDQPFVYVIRDARNVPLFLGFYSGN